MPTRASSGFSPLFSRNLLASLFTAAFAVAPSGCAEETLEHQVCRRYNTCIDRQDLWEDNNCADEVTDCTEDLSSSEKREWNEAANACLNKNSCATLMTCIDDLNKCI